MTTKALLIAPMEHPKLIDLENTLEAKQHIVGGYIQAVYPWDDPVALICNDEGKLMDLPFNRVLRDPEGKIYDAVHGTFLIVGIEPDNPNFVDLRDEDIKKFARLFHEPEMLVETENGKMLVHARLWNNAYTREQIKKKTKGDAER